MDIVYTYKTPQYSIPNRDRYQKDWLTLSLQSAKKLGYNTVLYTNSSDISKGLSIDELHLVNTTSRLWDSLKINVLETRKGDDYFLSDYDITYFKRLEFPNSVDIIFDAFEDSDEIWNRVYKDTLTRIGKKLINVQQPVSNVGVLKFNNTTLKEKYIEEWKKLEFTTRDSKINPVYLTATVTQYLLTTLLTEEIKVHTFSGYSLGQPNEYYHHYNGKQKINKIVDKVVI